MLYNQLIMVSTDTEAFIAADQVFMAESREMTSLDLLELHRDNLFSAVETADDELDRPVVAEFFDRAHDWLTNNTDPGRTRLGAVRRDLDKAVGACAWRKLDIPSEIPQSAATFDLFRQHGMGPRADYYEYAVGMHDGLGAVYGGDDREQALVKIFGDGIELAHTGIYGLLRTRDIIRQGDDIASAAEPLQQALASSLGIQRRMADAYREVGAAFVALRVTRYFRAIKYDGGAYEGPNPSHSGFLTFDRLVVGSVRRFLSDKPKLAAQYQYRESDVPPHHKDLLAVIEGSDDVDIIEMTAGTALEPTARALLASLRKTKVTHKSYADAGLVAAGKKLTHPDDDVLGPTIDHVRSLAHQ